MRCAGEGELLFPPLCNLEVVGSPRIEHHYGKDVAVVTFKISINQKGLRIEEILRHRHHTILGIQENLAREIKFDMQLVGVQFAESDFRESLLKKNSRNEGFGSEKSRLQ